MFFNVKEPLFNFDLINKTNKGVETERKSYENFNNCEIKRRFSLKNYPRETGTFYTEFLNQSCRTMPFFPEF